MELALRVCQVGVEALKFKHLVFKFADEGLVVEAVKSGLVRDRWYWWLQPTSGRFGEHFVHGFNEFGGLDRLHIEARGAELQGELPVPGSGVGGGVENERDPGEPLITLALAAEREPIHLRHQDIGDDQVGERFTGGGKRLDPVGGFEDLVPAGSQGDPEDITVRFEVIDNKDGAHPSLTVHPEWPPTHPSYARRRWR